VEVIVNEIQTAAGALVLQEDPVTVAWFDFQHQ